MDDYSFYEGLKKAIAERRLQITETMMSGGLKDIEHYKFYLRYIILNLRLKKFKDNIEVTCKSIRFPRRQNIRPVFVG